MSHYMIIFCSLLLTAVDVRAQCDRPFVGENRVLADDVDQQSFPDGSVLKFKCATGYVTLSGSRSITCTGNQWSELELQCKKRSCGNPGEIDNGRYQIPPVGGILFGATITATCNDGYQLVGYAKRNCLARGWDGRAPLCEVVKCLPPPSIKDGTYEPMEDFYNYNDVVTYSCDSGVNPIGASELTCSNDGTFQPAPPRCADVLCDRPEIPHAVRIEGKSPPYKLGNFVRYKCDKGYKMEGSDLLVCKENGWDPSLPQCTVITCSNPPTITNGVFNPSKESYMIEEKVTYDCVKGFKLYGSPTISCTDNGQFEKFLPECHPIICDSPLIPYSVIDESPPYTYDSVIKIKCNKGYKLEGSESLTCGNNGWIPALPRCIPLTCDAPSITDAYIVKGMAASYTYAMSIQVKCSKGYTMTGSDTLTCEENGWNPPPPKCNIVTCVPPLKIYKGHFTPVKSIYEYGQSVTYSCEEKFYIQGAATILCTEYGTFQHPPQCKEVVTCVPPPKINNGQFTPVKSIYESGQTVTYSCEEKFSIEGAATILCTEYGTFQHPPQCKEVVTCVPPTKINNGQFTPVKSIYEPGQTVTYSCEEEFSIEGAATILCTEYGTFQHPPQCKEVSDPWKWTIVIVVCILIILLVVVGVVGGYCYCQKKEESEKSTHGSKPETCSLVNVSSRHHPK